MKKTILTGDRATGRLHVGHLLGSLENRVKFQDEYNQFILIANIQGLTDNFLDPKKIRDSIPELILDYYAVGIDFNKSTVFIQSMIPQIHEIFIYISNFATVQQISHNPTIKTEILQKNYGESTPLGFYIYPVHQVADILSVRGELVPVGPGEVPQVEEAREIVRKFNSTYNVNILKEPHELLGVPKNVPGIDGNEKMGKSLNNCIYLSDSEEELKKKIFSMKTDPNRIHATDPGTVEGNTIFIYHSLFNSNLNEVEDLKERYRKGAVSDVEVKDKLFKAMNTVLTPIREKRLEGEKLLNELTLKVVNENTKKVQSIAKDVVEEIKEIVFQSFK